MLERAISYVVRGQDCLNAISTRKLKKLQNVAEAVLLSQKSLDSMKGNFKYNVMKKYRTEGPLCMLKYLKIESNRTMKEMINLHNDRADINMKLKSLETMDKYFDYMLKERVNKIDNGNLRKKFTIAKRMNYKLDEKVLKLKEMYAFYFMKKLEAIEKIDKYNSMMNVLTDQYNIVLKKYTKTKKLFQKEIEKLTAVRCSLNKAKIKSALMSNKYGSSWEANESSKSVYLCKKGNNFTKEMILKHIWKKISFLDSRIDSFSI